MKKLLYTAGIALVVVLAVDAAKGGGIKLPSIPGLKG